MRFVTTATLRILSLTLDAQSTWILGAAVRVQALPGVAATLLAVRDAGTVQIGVRLNTDGTLSALRGTTVIGTSTATLTVNVYAYLELATLLHPSTGTVEVRLNGVAVVTVPAGDTTQTANSTANEVAIGSFSNTALTVDFDDVYICDGTGAAPHNTFLGDCRVDTLLPSADGTSQQWTPSTPGTHYTLVDDAAPNTTDYVSSSTVGQRDTYGMQDLTAATGTIYGVQLNLAALKSDAGARSIKPLVLSGASEALGSATALSTSQTYTRHVQTTDPATAAAWTEAGVNAAQCGAEVA